jgi:hypothetical protein
VEVIRYWLGKANESLAAAEDEMDVTVPARANLWHGNERYGNQSAILESDSIRIARAFYG